MRRLYEVCKEVENLLETKPETRDSDDVLYFSLITSLQPGLTTYDVFVHRERYGLPPYESVRRSRQKLQANRPDLRGSKKVRELRREREEEYLEFAHNG